MVKKVILFLLLLCPAWSVHATDPAVLNGYWYMDNLDSMLIRYPYIWSWEQYHDALPSIRFSQMRLIESKKMNFLFLYEKKAFAVEKGGYFNSAQDDQFFQEPYHFARFTVTSDADGYKSFHPERCTDKTLNERHDLMKLSDEMLAGLIEKSTCHARSQAWKGDDWVPYRQADERHIENIPWFFAMIAPEFLPYSHVYHGK